jgi:hypothetical protein
MSSASASSSDPPLSLLVERNSLEKATESATPATDTSIKGLAPEGEAPIVAEDEQTASAFDRELGGWFASESVVLAALQTPSDPSEDQSEPQGHAMGSGDQSFLSEAASDRTEPESTGWFPRYGGKQVQDGGGGVEAAETDSDPLLFEPGTTEETHSATANDLNSWHMVVQEDVETFPVNLERLKLILNFPSFEVETYFAGKRADSVNRDCEVAHTLAESTFGEPSEEQKVQLKGLHAKALLEGWFMDRGRDTEELVEISMNTTVYVD